jgi:hypothetical protein
VKSGPASFGSRLDGALVSAAAVGGIAGMLPMAARLGEGGGQTASLGRLSAASPGATFTTLIVLPAIFAMVQH